MALPLPVLFVRFIGVCEVLGALGLVLPGVFRIRTDLTPLAAQGLVVIMIGAVTTMVATMDASMAILPLVVGVLTGAVAYGRTRVAPLTDRRSNRVRSACRSWSDPPTSRNRRSSDRRSARGCT